MLKRVVGMFLILALWSVVSHASNPFSEGDFVSVPGLEGIEVQKHELTYGQYQVLNSKLPQENQSPWDANNCHLVKYLPKAKDYDVSDFPAACVSLKDAEAYVREANKPENQGGTQQYVYRLPTDCELRLLVEMTLERNTDGSRVSDDDLDSRAWHSTNSDQQVQKVCMKDKFHGLCDVLGNLWEWTSTEKRKGGGLFFFRGGSWQTNVGLLYSYNIDFSSTRNHDLGVRLVRTPKE